MTNSAAVVTGARRRDGQTFHKAPEKKLALRHMQAWNDWRY